MLYHHLSKSIGKSDALSHRPDHGNRSHDNENMVLLKLEFLTAQAIKEMTFEDKE